MKQVQILATHAGKPNTLMPLTRFNYQLLFIALGVILLGFILMLGGNSDDPHVFDPAIFDFQRITLAPIMLLLGYSITGAAILLKSQKR